MNTHAKNEIEKLADIIARIGGDSLESVGAHERHRLCILAETLLDRDLINTPHLAGLQSRVGR